VPVLAHRTTRGLIPANPRTARAVPVAGILNQGEDEGVLFGTGNRSQIAALRLRRRVRLQPAIDHESTVWAWTNGEITFAYFT
jgi:hypothetical protein